MEDLFQVPTETRDLRVERERGRVTNYISIPLCQAFCMSHEAICKCICSCMCLYLSVSSSLSHYKRTLSSQGLGTSLQQLGKERREGWGEGMRDRPTLTALNYAVCWNAGDYLLKSSLGTRLELTSLYTHTLTHSNSNLHKWVDKHKTADERWSKWRWQTINNI